VRGRLLAESLRHGHDLRVRDLVVIRIGRHDMATRTAGTGFRAAEDHIVVFAGRIVRYRVGGEAGCAAAVEYGRAARLARLG
jgi:hypothetical protein